MSKDEEDNLVCFNKAHNESKSNKAQTVEERVKNCFKNKDCECMYCTYKQSAATMVIEFLSRDVLTFENNTGAKFVTYDLKDVFFRAIREIKKMESEIEPEE